MTASEWREFKQLCSKLGTVPRVIGGCPKSLQAMKLSRFAPQRPGTAPVRRQSWFSCQRLLNERHSDRSPTVFGPPALRTSELHSTEISNCRFILPIQTGDLSELRGAGYFLRLHHTPEQIQPILRCLSLPTRMIYYEKFSGLV